MWDEWVHLLLTASVLPLAFSSAAPSFLFCSRPLLTIAHLPLWMVSLLFSLSPSMGFDLPREKKKRPEEITLALSSTFMLPEQKLCLHENQIGKRIKHGDFETRSSPDSQRSPEVRKSLSAPCFCVSALFSAQVRALCHHSWLLFCLSWSGKHVGMHDRA